MVNPVNVFQCSFVLEVLNEKLLLGETFHQKWLNILQAKFAENKNVPIKATMILMRVDNAHSGTFVLKSRPLSLSLRPKNFFLDFETNHFNRDE